jgi:large subunit ribosomal protein L40e
VSDCDIKEGDFIYVRKRTRISIDAPGPRTFTMHVDLSETIGDLKAAIEAEKGIAVDTQRISFGGIMRANSAGLGDCGIALDSKLSLKIRAFQKVCPPDDGIQILVRLISGKTITIFTRKSSVVKDVKAEIEGKVGILPEFQLLVFQGKKLQDDRTLFSYNITKDSTLNLTSRLFSHRSRPIVKLCTKDFTPFLALIPLDFDITIGEVKKSIDKTLLKKCHFPIVGEKFNLFYEGGKLVDDKKLSDYVSETPVLYMIELWIKP